MEDSHGESVFESLNLNPQLFINEVLNIVDDLVDVAFDFFLQEASVLLNTKGADRSVELSKGVSYIRSLIQSALDQRMRKWEEYCLRVCFRVPEEFSLPKSEEEELCGDDLQELNETEVDVQLHSLREKLVLVGKECAELDRKVCTLEKQSLSSKRSAASIDEALQSYLKHDSTQMFQDLSMMASEFRASLLNLKRKRIKDVQCNLRTRLADDVTRGNGLFGAEVAVLEDFLDQIAT